MAYGTGIVAVVEPFLALMISGPPGIRAGIPAGDPRIGSGSKCDAIGHDALLLLSPRRGAYGSHATSNTGPSQSSVSNPIGTEKRHSLKRGVAPRARGRRLP